ncbi:MAG: PAS domain S-box protein, partial [Wenzhouxiangellaceae bacterium]
MSISLIYFLLIALWIYLVLRYSRHQLSLGAELRKAISHGYLLVHYQPIVECAGGPGDGAGCPCAYPTGQPRRSRSHRPFRPDELWLIWAALARRGKVLDTGAMRSCAGAPPMIFSARGWLACGEEQMAFSDKPPILKAAIKESDYSVVITTDELELPGPMFVHVNDAFTRMTGYTREELLGATPRILQGPDTDRKVLNRLKSNLRAGDSFEGHTWNYRKDGTPYLVEWTITRLRHDGEGTDYFFSVQHEITDQSQTEQSLDGRTRRLNALLNSAGTNHDPISGTLNHRGMLLRLQRLIDETAAGHSVTGLVS